MITTFRSTKYTRPQFSYGLAPMAVWLSNLAVEVAAAITLSVYLGNRDLEAYAKTVVGTDTLRQYYGTGADYSAAITTSNWRGQSFTPSLTHDVSKVKLYIYREGSTAGNVVLGIRATSGGKPTGGDLVSKSLVHTDIPTSFGWVEFAFATPYTLSAGVMYAIVIRRDNAGGSIQMRGDMTSPTYTDGTFLNSTDSGISWTIQSFIDALFEEYEKPITILGIDAYLTNRDIEAYMKGLLS